MNDPVGLLEPLRRLHVRIRNDVVAATEQQQIDDLSGIRRDEEGDTIYGIDAVGEDTLREFCEELAERHSFVLIAEGLRNGQLVYPESIDEDAAAWRIIVDPIDGTRGIMYQKRSAWVLTGVAPNRGPETSLEDIVLAVQTEIPTLKQHLADEIWAMKGRGVTAERYNRLTGDRTPLHLRPSKAGSIAHGFAMVSRFFPGARDELAAIDEEIMTGALGPVQHGKAHAFEDQYISSGGQLYELMSGHDRFVADLRPLMESLLARRGLSLGICCHPYDLCSALIADQLGVIITDVVGQPLRARLNVRDDVAWIGYANARIRAQVEPLLQTALRNRGLI